MSIKGFLETSFVDWPGKVVSVLFLPQCNFRCPFCHNHSLIINPEGHEDIPRTYIMARLAELEGWVDGVCISGGEPTIHPRLPALIAEIKGLGLLVKLDTNGSRPHVLQSLVEEGLVDCVAMDIKAPLDEMSYARAAGAPVDLEKIRKSICFLQKGKVEYQFRTTVVPALHKEEDLLHLAHHLSGSSSLTLQNFRPADPLDPQLKGTSPYPEEWLKEMGEKIGSILHH
ncbi:MAG: anaerobic ribonucleoside-triphosphate reductase activating protein [Deltaproteobacteria bacterium RBG_13_52_11]|nr:MAG: anaerobic ribonucleoside-triphosphate reductase activating protein [Deltaproteobacteria bacterium RBG_13_52_11]